MSDERVVKARIEKHGQGRKVTVWTYDGSRVRRHVRVFASGEEEGRRAFVKDPKSYLTSFPAEEPEGG
jgi:hypothetical protein